MEQLQETQKLKNDSTVKLRNDSNDGDRFPLVVMDDSKVYIVNFSSLHFYVFDNGQILDGCTREIAYKYKLEPDIIKTPRWTHIDQDDGYGVDHGLMMMKEYGEQPDWYDIDLVYKMPEHMFEALAEIASHSFVDIILVPFPVMQCFKAHEFSFSKKFMMRVHEERKEGRDKYMMILDKIRVCKKVDPRDVSKGILSNEFCT